ncbi:LacI family DNA-binding transcriptional regulator [Oscillospiraceae bacterium MB08-C2-2]|nr:LacI family DNA-binding transcriptional regulator [Oscillospiraceae bacterium MB08-C2-2]
MATIADVAKKAGVSVATVSRVLNKQSTVSGKTVSRVKAAIEELSYEPNMLARNFRRSESRVILILAPNITNPYYAHILSGIGAKARSLGYSALICTTEEDKAREAEYLDMLAKNRADGAILLATENDEDYFREIVSQYSLVQCSEPFTHLETAHVSIDNYKAARHVVRHLLDTGHQRIATISSVNNYTSTGQRLMGYKDELLEAGLAAEPEMIVYGSRDYSFASGYEAAKKLLQQRPRPSAIFCISDMLALGAVHAAKDMGLLVPGELSVIGFDDVEYATTFSPALSTVAQPCYQLGECSMELLFSLMNGGDVSKKQMVLDFNLIIRDSSAPLHAGL